MTDAAKKIIKEVVTAYDESFGNGYGEMEVEDMVASARKRRFGDTLLSFIVLELEDTIGYEKDLATARNIARQTLRTSMADLDRAMGAI